MAACGDFGEHWQAFMNLLLFDRAERDGAELVLRDRRAIHILSVIRPALGDPLRVGEISGGHGNAEVLELGADWVRLRLGELTASVAQPACAELTLTVALPRPKVIPRLVAAVASFGVSRIELINAWRVDKSYFSSPVMSSDALSHAARLGCEQGGHTRLPGIAVFSRFMLWLDQLEPPLEDRCVLHPRAQGFLTASVGALGPVRLAIGPERGWIDAELKSLEDERFAPVRLTSSVLRVEPAVAAALGQLELLRACH